MGIKGVEYLTYVPGFAFVLLLIVFKIYMKYTCGVCKTKRIMIGKTVIITGANKGIGKETALDLAARGARVILACRDHKRAIAARDEIIRLTSNPNVVVQRLDLASLSSVRSFAQKILDTEDRLDVLINCAGVGGLKDVLTEDGLQIEMQTNYFGAFLLTNLLVDLLIKSAPSRIIFISSKCHHHGRIDLNNLNDCGKHITNRLFEPYVRYSSTKLANILHANKLAQILDGTGVTVNSCHPGAVVTDIHKGFQILYYPITFFLKCFCKTAEEGAQTGIFLAVSEKVGRVSAKYFEDCKIATPSMESQDTRLTEMLWEKTVEMLESCKMYKSTKDV